MDDLLKRRIGNDKNRKKRKKEDTIVSYSLNGHVIRGKLSKWKKACIYFAGVMVAFALFIYVPPMFYKETSANSYIPITPNASAIKDYQTFLKDHPDDDFDGDGLNNALENEYGTDVWDMDTDGDGVTDYAELFVTETSPTDASTILMKQVSDEDNKKGTTLGTPYKIDDIIFWPDTYQSKAYGAVVRTIKGYRFCNYTGWVRFPEHVYAYRYSDGVHYEMTYRENEDAWKIETDDEILLYEEPLTFIHRLSLPFLGDFYLEDGKIGGFLSSVLPDKGGYITCRRMSTIDTIPKEESSVQAPLNPPLINRENLSRFAQNTNTLKDLSRIRQLIDIGECTAVSLYSGDTGEAIGIIYGYTDEGDFLVADENLKPVGKIEIVEYAMRMVDKEGTNGQVSWFEWSGLGFDSLQNGDRINFFSSTLTSSKDSNDDQQTAVEIEYESETEYFTERITEAESEKEVETQSILPETESIKETEIYTEAEPVVTEPVTEKNTEPVQVTETQKETVAETEPMTESTEKQDSVITFGF